MAAKYEYTVMDNGRPITTWFDRESAREEKRNLFIDHGIKAKIVQSKYALIDQKFIR